MRFLVIPILILIVFSSPSYCQDDYIQGRIAIVFKPEVFQDDASKFVKQFNLDILRIGNFDPPLIHFVIESDVDKFVGEIEREYIVSLVTKGERLEVNDREGTVVRVRFKRGVDKEKIDELSLSYQKGKKVIAWRYFKSGPPYMIINVPPGKEQDWLNVFSKSEYNKLVEFVKLIAIDL